MARDPACQATTAGLYYSATDTLTTHQLFTMTDSLLPKDLSLKALFDLNGYIIVPNLIPPPLLQPLKEACNRVVFKTRKGDWPHRRIVGKQFPPFIDTEGEPDSWGVQHLMHPDLEERVFAEWYGSEGLRNVCKELMECKEEDLQMGASTRSSS